MPHPHWDEHRFIKNLSDVKWGEKQMGIAYMVFCVVSNVFWVVARSLLFAFEMFWVVARLLLCGFKCLGCC